jgi:hypothetical protein
MPAKSGIQYLPRARLNLGASRRSDDYWVARSSRAPTGYTRLAINAIRIMHASASLTTTTVGAFTVSVDVVVTPLMP